eukprot:12431010-Ditylum_brightwellii.AAC.1
MADHFQSALSQEKEDIGESISSSGGEGVPQFSHRGYFIPEKVTVKQEADHSENKFGDDGDDGVQVYVSDSDDHNNKDAGGGDKKEGEDDDDYSSNELCDDEEDKDDYDDEGDGDDGENEDQSDGYGESDDDGDDDDDGEEGDNDVRDVINVNLTDHWVDEFKNMKKQNKYFTIGYNEFMWSKFEE